MQQILATDDRLNGRQLHIEDYLRIIPAEQGKETGVPDYRRIADDDSISRYFQPDNLMEIILRTDNCRASDYYHWRCVSYVRLFSEKVKNSDR